MIYVIADTHGKDIKLPDDCTNFIHLGDFQRGLIKGPICPCVLVKGNHDMDPDSLLQSFDLIVDGLLVDGIWLSHEPAERLPKGAHLNVHGHLHENNYEDYGYVKKPFHVCLTPDAIYPLEKFTGESHA